MTVLTRIVSASAVKMSRNGVDFVRRFRVARYLLSFLQELFTLVVCILLLLLMCDCSDKLRIDPRGRDQCEAATVRVDMAIRLSGLSRCN